MDGGHNTLYGSFSGFTVPDSGTAPCTCRILYRSRHDYCGSVSSLLVLIHSSTLPPVCVSTVQPSRSCHGHGNIPSYHPAPSGWQRLALPAGAVARCNAASMPLPRLPFGLRWFLVIRANNYYPLYGTRLPFLTVLLVDWLDLFLRCAVGDSPRYRPALRIGIAVTPRFFLYFVRIQNAHRHAARCRTLRAPLSPARHLPRRRSHRRSRVLT